MATRKKITLGIALAVGILGALTAVWITVPLFVIAGLLFAWGLEPKRREVYPASAVRQQLHSQGIG